MKRYRSNKYDEGVQDEEITEVNVDEGVQDEETQNQLLPTQLQSYVRASHPVPFLFRVFG